MLIAKKGYYIVVKQHSKITNQKNKLGVPQIPLPFYYIRWFA